MLRSVFLIFLVACLDQAHSELSACPLKVAVPQRETLYQDVFKWKAPEDNLGQTGKPVPSGRFIELGCGNGFLKNELKSERYTFQCNNGKFNRTFLYEDLLCRSEQFKNIDVERTTAFRSKMFKCSEPNYAMYHVRVRKSDGSMKVLYTSCVDEKLMKSKFTHQPRRKDRPQLMMRPPNAVWGFDAIGTDTNERVYLSRGYVKNAQAKRIGRFFDNKFPNKEYPYYFNRGHLAAMADYTDREEALATCEYLNAAPQWETLNSESWSLVEREARSMLQTDTDDWEIYTGTYGIIPSPRGPVFAGVLFDENGKFKKVLLPVPMLYWKIVNNVKDNTKSRAFVGVNNPELKSPDAFPSSYKICTPIRPDETGALYKGSEFKGFTYECKVEDLLSALKREEKIVK